MMIGKCRRANLHPHSFLQKYMGIQNPGNHQHQYNYNTIEAHNTCINIENKRRKQAAGQGEKR